MLTDIEKKYWKKVYMYFGNDFRAWYFDKTLFHREYQDLVLGDKIRRYQFLIHNEYVKWDITMFTQKFIDEISK